MSETQIIRQRLRVTGVVQGVGFRPHVYRLAQSLGLTGFVGNDSSGVFIEIEGDPQIVANFIPLLRQYPPPIAHIDTIDSEMIPPVGSTSFTIAQSVQQPDAQTLVSPDLALCDDCLRELFDPENRRYRYPFINCTNCGPRYTIIRALPYDRPYTTMTTFSMCEPCTQEYHDAKDRRFHAQPNACPTCGPQVQYLELTGTAVYRDEAIHVAQQALKTGKILAVKGIGGFHLACDATNASTVETLRTRKGRYEKPFAVMVRDINMARQLVDVSYEAEGLLHERARPIVLLPKLLNADSKSPLAEVVAPLNPRVGVMLPYSPLHYLLLHDLGFPVVMTSGNHSGEPMIIDNAIALIELSDIADGFLMHDRDIYTPCDDSVIIAARTGVIPVRRSRGYAPFPVKIAGKLPPILAVGAEVKNTFCLAAGDQAFMSQHIGDMENLPTLDSFDRAVAHMSKLFRIQPQAVVADIHPAYSSSQRAKTLAEEYGIPLITVQHHHAHIASVMAENGLDGSHPVIGFSFDGTGYGTDKKIWGGEVLIADYDFFERAAHLREIPLAGGDTAVKKPYRAALGHLWEAGIAWDDDLAPVKAPTAEELRILRTQFERGFNVVATSSMGRLFDAAASLLDIRQRVSYEAQAAIEMEGAVAGWMGESVLTGVTPFDLYETDRGLIFDAAPVLRAIIDQKREGIQVPMIAARFHGAIMDVIVKIALRIRDEQKLNTVALTGGVFQNSSLLEITHRRLVEQDFQVIMHRLVPPNDGGLALGQAVIGARKLNKGF